jgi:hypothetical protein
MIEFPDVFMWNPPHKNSPRVVFDLEKHFMFIISNYKITNINKTYVSGQGSRSKKSVPNVYPSGANSSAQSDPERARKKNCNSTSYSDESGISGKLCVLTSRKFLFVCFIYISGLRVETGRGAEISSGNNTCTI